MEREKWIDSLKGIACVIVFVSHFWLTFGYTCIGLNEIVTIRPFNILVNGNYAVCLFLIISAYVISKPIYLAKDFKRVQKTLLKRYPRLMLPVFFSSLFAYVLYSTMGYFNQQAGEVLKNEWLMGKYNSPLTIKELILTSFIKVWCNGDASFNAPFWMLQILFFGTFLTVIITMMTAVQKKYGILILTMLICVYIYISEVYLCFILGTLLAYLGSRNDIWKHQKKNNCHLGINIILMVCAICLPGYAKEIINIVSYIIPNDSFVCDTKFYNIVGSFLLIFSLMGMEGVKHCLESSKILDKVKEVSFSIYLVHWPIICSFSCFLYLSLQGTNYKKSVICTVVFLCTTVIVALVSKIFYTVVERKICDRVVEKICNVYFEESK